MLGGDDGGEQTLKAQIKEECRLMSELGPVISALADRLACFPRVLSRVREFFQFLFTFTSPFSSSHARARHRSISSQPQ